MTVVAGVLVVLHLIGWAIVLGGALVFAALASVSSRAAAEPFVKRAVELFDGDADRLRYVAPRDGSAN